MPWPCPQPKKRGGEPSHIIMLTAACHCLLATPSPYFLEHLMNVLEHPHWIKVVLPGWATFFFLWSCYGLLVWPPIITTTKWVSGTTPLATFAPEESSESLGIQTRSYSLCYVLHVSSSVLTCCHNLPYILQGSSTQQSNSNLTEIQKFNKPAPKRSKRKSKSERKFSRATVHFQRRSTQSVWRSNRRCTRHEQRSKASFRRWPWRNLKDLFVHRFIDKAPAVQGILRLLWLQVGQLCCLMAVALRIRALTSHCKWISIRCAASARALRQPSWYAWANLSCGMKPPWLAVMCLIPWAAPFKISWRWLIQSSTRPIRRQADCL